MFKIVALELLPVQINDILKMRSKILMIGVNANGLNEERQKDSIVSIVLFLTVEIMYFNSIKAIKSKRMDK
jgi:hypothetical protein